MPHALIKSYLKEEIANDSAYLDNLSKIAQLYNVNQELLNTVEIEEPTKKAKPRSKNQLLAKSNSQNEKGAVANNSISPTNLKNIIEHSNIDQELLSMLDITKFNSTILDIEEERAKKIIKELVEEFSVNSLVVPTKFIRKVSSPFFSAAPSSLAMSLHSRQKYLSVIPAGKIKAISKNKTSTQNNGKKNLANGPTYLSIKYLAEMAKAQSFIPKLLNPKNRQLAIEIFSDKSSQARCNLI